MFDFEDSTMIEGHDDQTLDFVVPCLAPWAMSIVESKV